jgi:16S rRNA (uracil1498-N3)-methyltransferase
LTSEYLSEIELYYSPVNADSHIIISGEEFHHLVKVMRHNSGEEIQVTDGQGKIFRCKIENIYKDSALLLNLQEFSYTNNNSGITLCLPYLKNTDRLEYALEKCTELGITSFIIYTSERTLRRSFKTDRWNKILLSAMKQSLRAFLPKLETYSLKEICDLTPEKIIFDQKAEKIFDKRLIKNEALLLIGPEGGFSSYETGLFSDAGVYNLAPNRLRSETAAVVCAARLI